jgi:hypothetical protein
MSSSAIVSEPVPELELLSLLSFDVPSVSVLSASSDVLLLESLEPDGSADVSSSDSSLLSSLPSSVFSSVAASLSVPP